jgi:hypothetical protein
MDANRNGQRAVTRPNLDRTHLQARSGLATRAVLERALGFCPIDRRLALGRSNVFEGAAWAPKWWSTALLERAPRLRRLDRSAAARVFPSRHALIDLQRPGSIEFRVRCHAPEDGPSLGI